MNIRNKFVQRKIKDALVKPILKIRRQKSTFAPSPTIISLNLTYTCNLRCRMCGQNGIRGTLKEQGKTSELSLEIIRKLVHELKSKKKKPLIYLWGGEPFLHSKIIPIITLFKKNGFTLHINTNGTLLEKYAKEIIDLKVDAMTVSIDGPEKIHDEVRRVKGTFKRLSAGIYKINSLKKRKSDAPLLKSFCTISDKSVATLDQMPGIVEKLGLSYLTFIHLMYTNKKLGQMHQDFFNKEFMSDGCSWSGFSAGIEKKINLNLLKKQIRKIKEQKNTISVKFFPELKEDKINTYYRHPEIFIKRRCIIPWNRVDITPDGNIVACPDTPDYIIGNLEKDGFFKLWNSWRYRHLRGCLQEKDFPFCSRCCKVF